MGETDLNYSGEIRSESASINFDEIFPINETQIEDDAISTPKLQANAVIAEKIGAKEVTADKMNVSSLSAINAYLGEAVGGTFKTNANLSSPRVVMTSSGNIPFWIGTGTRNMTNAILGYDKSTGELVYRGKLSVKSATSGGRLEIENDYIRVFDESGRLRVEFGNLI